MKLNVRGVVLLGMALGPGMLHAQVANLSGTWNLNVQKSSWGKATQPTSITLQIEHHEPRFRYTGAAVFPNGDSRDFSFDGAIDGKPYPAVGASGQGTMTLSRKSPTALTSVFRSKDGKYVETGDLTVSRDGKTITQKMSVTSPEGKRNWTEVYDKR